MTEESEITDIEVLTGSTNAFTQQQNTILRALELFIRPLIHGPQNGPQRLTTLNISSISSEITRETGHTICPTILLMIILKFFLKGKKIKNNIRLTEFYSNITRLVFYDIDLSDNYRQSCIIAISKIFHNCEILEFCSNNLSLINMGSFIEELSFTKIKNVIYIENSIYPATMSDIQKETNKYKLIAIIKTLIQTITCFNISQFYDRNCEFINMFCEIMNSNDSSIKKLTIGNVYTTSANFKILTQDLYENPLLELSLENWVFDNPHTLEVNSSIVSTLAELIENNGHIQYLRMVNSEENIPDDEEDTSAVSEESENIIAEACKYNEVLTKLEIDTFYDLHSAKVKIEASIYRNLHRCWIPKNHTLFMEQFHKILITFLLLNFVRTDTTIPLLPISVCSNIFGFFTRKSQKTFEYFE